MMEIHSGRQNGAADTSDGRDGSPPENDNVVAIEGNAQNSRQWTIKGISPDTVSVSREAARRSGMKLNSWVGSALQKAAASESASTDSEAEEIIARRMQELEGYMKLEFDRLRLQSAQIESTVNTISSILLKLSVKNELIK